MAYRLPLLNIQRMTDEEFAEIPECDPKTVILKEPGRTKENQAYFFELCRDISLGRKESLESGKPYPRYIPVIPVYRGGEGLVIRALDQWKSNLEVIIKFPWPKFRHEEYRETKQKIPTKVHRGVRIETSPEGMHKVAKSLYRRLMPPKRHKKEYLEKARTKEEAEQEEQREKKLKESVQYERFHRSFVFQEQAHRRGRAVDKNRQFGYIPKTFDFSFDPKCYFSMEYLSDCIPYFDWIRGHNLQENISLFLRLLTFVRLCLHDAGVAHCDLNAHSNVLVNPSGVPCILDFGIAKGERLPSITVQGEQLGTPETASPTQMEKAEERGVLDDIFSLGRILHVTLTGKRPALSAIWAQKDAETGKLVYDHEVLQGLFPISELPLEYRRIFEKTYQNGYAELIEFQRDVEEIVYLNAPVEPSIEPEIIERLDRLELLIKGIIETLKFLGE